MEAPVRQPRLPRPTQDLVDKWRQSKTKALKKLQKEVDALKQANPDLDASEVDSVLSDYADLRRDDYDSAEDFAEAKSEGWDAILEALDSMAGEEDAILEEKEREVRKPEPTPRPTHQRGGFLRPFGLGLFIRDYLSGKGTVYGAGVSDPQRGTPIESVKVAYKTALFRAYAEDMVVKAKEKGVELSVEEAILRIPHRSTSIRSHSFYSYFQHLKMLGWVESTGEEEDSLFGGMVGARVERTPQGTTLVEIPQPRRFYRLTTLGQEAPDYAWSDPVQALYDYPPEQRHRRKFVPKPGSLPRRPAKAVRPRAPLAQVPPPPAKVPKKRPRPAKAEKPEELPRAEVDMEVTLPDGRVGTIHRINAKEETVDVRVSQPGAPVRTRTIEAVRLGLSTGPPPGRAGKRKRPE